MLATLGRAIKIGDLRARILFTLAMLLVFRLGVHVPTPGVIPERVAPLFATGSIFQLLDLFAGGALATVSVFAMSITPYINASIIVQLLTVVIPRLEELAKEGEEGRRRLTQLTRYGTVVMALLQAGGIAYYLHRAGALEWPGFPGMAVVAITLTAGTVLLMWIGEQITENGIGNGISLLIFAGIVSRLPHGLVTLTEMWRAGSVTLFQILLLVVLGLAVIVAVVWVTEGQRRIPVQYAKRVVGRRIYGGQSTHIPIRVNQAGVIPVIFAASLVALPLTVAGFFPQAGWSQFIGRWFGWGTPLNTVIYFWLIVGFTFFYTAITFNPQDIADNLRKYGGYIPGLRPGRPTAEYLARVVTRITVAGALFLALISVLPLLVRGVTQIATVYFGGTALLIVVGVALETMKQIEAHLLMRQYQGFMKR
ncbi:preprotein translocase subunit SecY [Thermaerobacter composti]|uniref:Protein translocase subunit SecY n=1 Tax=Thermaerobacter composti TaxID=554949 RepID=A0ABZ0QP55_9FIRM|nr:preprotein translocase subunit SecY [Thermaerobacter composti]WPD19024.1 preprotein translocase subunit SecY [Thermaerobacter composti]